MMNILILLSILTYLAVAGLGLAAFATNLSEFTLGGKSIWYTVSIGVVIILLSYIYQPVGMVIVFMLMLYGSALIIRELIELLADLLGLGPVHEVILFVVSFAIFASIISALAVL